MKMRKDAGTWWCDCKRLKEVIGTSWACRKVLRFCLQPASNCKYLTPPVRRPRALCVITWSHGLGVGSLTAIPSYAPCTVIKYCITRFAQDNHLLQPRALLCSPGVAAICQTDSVTPPLGNRYRPRSDSPITKTAQLPSCTSRCRLPRDLPREHLRTHFYTQIRSLARLCRLS